MRSLEFRHGKRWRGRWRFLFFAALSGAVLGAAGCVYQPPKAPPAGPLFFPPPPQPARVQYLGSLSSPKDLPSPRSSFAEFVLGAEPAHNLMAKPNNAVFRGTQLYVGDTVLNTILIYDLVTGKTHRLLGDKANGKIEEPNNFTFDEQGFLYVADKKRKAILVYGPDEGFVRAMGKPDGGAPVAVAVGKDKLYVVDIRDHQIEVWDKQSGEVLRTIGTKGTKPGQFYYPTNIAIDPEGNLCVTDTANFRVQVVTPEGNLVRTFGSLGHNLGQFSWPKGIDVDGKGRIYVADSRFANVQMFDKGGKLLLFYGGPGPERGNLDLPSGVRVCPWPAGIPWLESKLSSGFRPEFLVVAVSQKGVGFINFFAVAQDPGNPS